MELKENKEYCSDDYWRLPEGERAELIHGQLYAMAPPGFLHQKLVMEISAAIHRFIKEKHGRCEVIPAPFAVNLDQEDKNWVEPDISVICDKEKITGRGCVGAPDLIIEVVSPSTRKADYCTKYMLYAESGVKEYWIVDPKRQTTMIYRFMEDFAPVIYPFAAEMESVVLPGLLVCIRKMLEG